MTILWLLLLLLAALGVGAPIAGRLLPPSHKNDLTVPILSIWLGAGILGLVSLLGNAAGILPRPVAVSMIVAAALSGLRSAYVLRRAFRIDAMRWEDAIGLFGLLVLYLWYASSSWYPVLHVDSYAYHFTTAKQWLMEGRIRPVPFEAHANFYQLWTAWLYWGIALEPDNFLLPRQTVTLGLLSLGIVLALELRRRTGARFGSWLAGAAWMMTLEAVEVGVTDYMDMILAGMFLLAVLAMRWAFEEEIPGPRLLLLAGLLGGLTIGLKITGLALAFVLGVALLAALVVRRVGWRQGLMLACLYGLTSIALWLPWAIKNGCITGNPFYPFLLGTFSTGSEYEQVARDFHRFYELGKDGPNGLARFLGNLYLYIHNIAHLDPNKIVAVFCVAVLVERLRRPPMEGMLLLRFAALLLLPLAYMLPARRFQLGPLIVLYLFAAEVVLVMGREFLRTRVPGWSRWVLVALAAWVIVWRIGDLRELDMNRNLQVERQLPRAFYMTPQAIREAHSRDANWAAVQWLEANLPRNRRVLVTHNIQLAALADVRVLSNVHIHGKTVLAILTEDQRLTASQLRARLDEWEIGCIFTEEDFSRNSALAEFREHELEPVMKSGIFTLYRLKGVSP